MKVKKTKNLVKNAVITIVVVWVVAIVLSLGFVPKKGVYAQVGGQCRFDQASCTWSPSSDATSYSITVTEVDTNTIIKQETLPAATTKYVFPITANRTYRCDVSAVNACGTLGPAGSAQALCAAEGVATPPPSSAPIVTPPPPTPIAKAPVTCGSSCTTQSDCQAGLTCIRLGNDSYCARPEYQAACVQTQTIAACCQPPAPKPTPPPVLPKTGLIEDTLLIILLGTTFAVLGFGGLLLTARKRR